jgi:hypothetical protein
VKNIPSEASVKGGFQLSMLDIVLVSTLGQYSLAGKLTFTDGHKGRGERF